MFYKPKDDLPFRTPYDDKKGTISLILGSPGAGKSFFAQELAIKYLLKAYPVIVVDSKDDNSRHLEEYLPIADYFKGCCSIRTIDDPMLVENTEHKRLIIFDESWRGIYSGNLLQIVDSINTINTDILVIAQGFHSHDKNKLLALDYDYIFIFYQLDAYWPIYSDFLSPQEVEIVYSLDTKRGKYSNVFIKGNREGSNQVKKIIPSRFNLRLIEGKKCVNMNECNMDNLSRWRGQETVYNLFDEIIKNIPEELTEVRKKAYFRLFEASYSLLRTSSFDAMRDQNSDKWFPELVMNITEIFRNLPSFLVNDFKGDLSDFNEKIFWEQFLTYDKCWVIKYCWGLPIAFLRYLEKSGEE